MLLTLKDFGSRLTSRKFLITIGLIIALTLFPDLPGGVVQLALAYLGVEGLADVVRAYTASRIGSAQIDKDIALITQGEYRDPNAIDNNKGPIVPGQ